MADDETLRPGETWAQWGARTGRYGADRVAFWQGQLDAEQRVIAAGGGSDRLSRVEAAIRELYPAMRDLDADAPPFTINAAGRTVYAGSTATSRLDELHTALWGEQPEVRHARQDAEAEAELSAMDAADRVNAASATVWSDAEHRAFFGGE